MSEKAPRKQENQPSKLRKGAVAGLLAIGALSGAAAGQVVDHVADSTRVEYEVGFETNESSPTRAAEQRMAQDIALEHYLGVAEGVTAVVEFENGSQLNIKNPIVERIVPVGENDLSNGVLVAAERTRGSDNGEGKPVTAYAPGVDGVKSISYLDPETHPDGVDTLDFGSFGQVDLIPLERVDGLSTDGGDGPQGNFFVPGEGADSTQQGLHVGQGTLYPAN